MSSPWKDFPNNKTERPFEGIPAGQEPEVMPGFTAPATDLWPPLSREQVVELHEALRDWWQSVHEDQSGGLVGSVHPTYNVRPQPLRGRDQALFILLSKLNLGTPPQPRRWTNDDIQAALEKRQAADPTGFRAPPVHYVQQERETIDRIRDSMTDDQFVAFCWGNVMKYRDRADSKGDPEADMRKALWYERMMLHVAVGSADPRSDRPNFQPYHRQPSDMPLVWVETAPSPTASLVSSPLGEVTLDEAMRSATAHALYAQQEAQRAVKRNCGTCRHYHQPSEMGCGVMETSRGARLWRMNAGALESDAQIRAWLEQSGDGCPGWEPKP